MQQFRKSLFDVSAWLASSLSSRQVAARGAVPDWPSGQAARGRMAAAQEARRAGL